MSEIESGAVRGRGGLFWSLLFPLLSLVLLVGGLSSMWVGWLRVQDESGRLRETLRGNAALLERMHLPMSERMVEDFSTAMGRPVAVVFTDGRVEGARGWGAVEKALAIEAARDVASVARSESSEALAVPLGQSGHLVVLHAIGDWQALRDVRSWLLLGVVTALGALAAYVLAKRLARPLEVLALSAPRFGEEELPESLVGRSDEVGVLARALDSARERILKEQSMRKQSERLAMLGQIATGLAHEIKNPAAAIVMQAQSLAAHAETQSAALLVREEAEEIIALVNQWLFIAQPMPPSRSRHDLVGEVTALLERRREVYAYHGVEVRCEAPESLSVVCDIKRVLQAVRNLVDNGIAAMAEGGELWLRITQRDGFAQVEVQDAGKGFSVAALEHFGEPFFSEKEGGMGLGLALVRGVAEAHGGGAEVENADGAIVRFWIPLEGEVFQKEQSK